MLCCDLIFWAGTTSGFSGATFCFILWVNYMLGWKYVTTFDGELATMVFGRSWAAVVDCIGGEVVDVLEGGKGGEFLRWIETVWMVFPSVGLFALRVLLKGFRRSTAGIC